MPEVLRALFVTYGVLDALDVKPLQALVFSAEDTPGSPETVILTYGYWQRRFNGDRSILGRAMTIIDASDRDRCHAQEFRFQRDPELILPARFDRSEVNLGTFAYRGVARLKPGVTIAQANARIWRACWKSGCTPGLRHRDSSARVFRISASDPRSSLSSRKSWETPERRSGS